jgi:hypothetical protein
MISVLFGQWNASVIQQFSISLNGVQIFPKHLATAATNAPFTMDFSREVLKIDCQESKVNIRIHF